MTIISCFSQAEGTINVKRTYKLNNGTLRYKILHKINCYA